MSYKRIIHDGVPHYGQHLMVHLIQCGEAILHEGAIHDFMVELVPAIDMQAYGPCRVFRFGEGEELGISAFQLIYTSNISMHTNDAHREGYFDLFSCRAFDVGQVLDRLRVAFNCVTDHEVFFRR